jgi:hypothetical protein
MANFVDAGFSSSSSSTFLVCLRARLNVGRRTHARQHHFFWFVSWSVSFFATKTDVAMKKKKTSF